MNELENSLRNIYYKPPGSENYLKLSEALDDLYAKINSVKDSMP